MTREATDKEVEEYTKRFDKRAKIFFKYIDKGFSETEARKKALEEVPEP